MIYFEQPLAIAISAIAALIMFIVLRRYGKPALPLSVLLGAIALLGLLISAPSIELPSDRAPNLFVVDVSGSMSSELEQRTWPLIREEIQRLHREQERATESIVLFIDREVVASLRAGASEELKLPEKVPQPRQPLDSRPWNFPSSLQGMRAPSTLVIFSDGAFKHEELQISLQKMQVDLSEQQIVVPDIDLTPRDAVRIKGIKGPGQVQIGNQVKMEVVFQCDRAVSARLEFSASAPADPERVLEPKITALELRPDRISRQSFFLPSEWFSEEGWIDVRVSVTVPGAAAREQDELLQNNHAAWSIRCGERLPVLYVRGPLLLAGADPLLELLQRRGGAEVKIVSPASLPDRSASYSGYGLIVLNDVPAAELPAKIQAALKQAVEVFGVPIAVAGSRDAWGPGGYIGSQLASVLPLNPDPRPNQPRQHLLLLDASDSMGERVAGSIGFAWLRQASESYLSQLGPQDMVEILPFNQQVSELLPNRLMSSEVAEDIALALSTVSPSGKTSIANALSVASDRLNLWSGGPELSIEERPRCLLISDGKATADDAPKLQSELERFAAALAACQGRFTLVLVGDQTPAWFNTLRELLAGGAQQADLLSVEKLEEIAKVLVRRMLDDRAARWEEAGPLRARFSSDYNESIAESEIDLVRVTHTALRKGAKRVLATLPSADEADQRSLPVMARWTIGAGRALGLALACDNAGATLSTSEQMQQALAQQLTWLEESQPRDEIEMMVSDAGENLQLTLLHRGARDRELYASFVADVIDESASMPSSAILQDSDLERSSIDLWEGKLARPSQPFFTLRVHGSQVEPAKASGVSGENESLEHTQRFALPVASEYLPSPASWIDLAGFARSNRGVVLEAGARLPNGEIDIRSEKQRARIVLLLTIIACIATAIWLRRPAAE